MHMLLHAAVTAKDHGSGQSHSTTCQGLHILAQQWIQRSQRVVPDAKMTVCFRGHLGMLLVVQAVHCHNLSVARLS